MARSAGAVAIEGYDAVSYFTDGAAVMGRAELSHEWRGASWWFSDPMHLEQFREAPERFAPQYGGYCAWAVSRNDTAKIDPEAWSMVDGKLYLNYSAKIKRRWEENRAENIAAGDANWPGLLRAD